MKKILALAGSNHAMSTIKKGCFPYSFTLFYGRRSELLCSLVGYSTLCRSLDYVVDTR